MARAKKVGFAVRVKETNGTYPRYEVTFKNGRPHRCRKTADAPEITIPADASFYATHPKDAKGNRATALGQGLDSAFAAFQKFEANFQRQKNGLALIEDFETNSPQAVEGRILIADAIAEYLLKIKTSDKTSATYSAYKLGLAGFKSSCTKAYIDELTEKDMVAYLAWMRDNVKKRKLGQANITFRKRLGFVNTFLGEYGKANLWDSKQWPKIVKKAPDKYDAETIAAILKAATPEEKLRLLFFFYSGCRDMEVATAEYSDVDKKTHIFKIQAKPHLNWKPKTSEERAQVLPAEFVRDLTARKAKSENNLIFPCPRSGKVDNNLIEYLQKAALRAGITERVTLHKIRRTAISHAIKKFGVTNAMKFAGHSSIQTTNKYAAPDDLTNQKVRKQVEESMAELVGA
jgi:integrase